MGRTYRPRVLHEGDPVENVGNEEDECEKGEDASNDVGYQVVREVLAF